MLKNNRRIFQVGSLKLSALEKKEKVYKGER
jgi:hypothetical protein